MMCALHKKRAAAADAGGPFVVRTAQALAPVRKALLSALFTGLGVVGSSMADGALSGGEVIMGMGAAMVAFSVTWAVPNDE